MKKKLSFSSLKDIFILILGWRFLLFLIAFFATSLYARVDYPFPYVDTILLPTDFPAWVWGFANFDGVHYLRTGLWGYVSDYSQAFFPLFPLLIWFMSSWNTFFEQKSILLISGLLISFFSTFGGFYFLHKVYEIEFKKKYISYALFLLISFPTSFYFLGVYTESFFLLLASIAILLIVKKKYIFAAIFIALATATKVVGVFLIAVYFIELSKDLYLNKNKESWIDLFIKLFGVVISCAGIILYMFYLYVEYNNPFYFINAQPVFGGGRQVESFILLPQVFYRYLKIFITVPVFSYHFFSALNEFIFAILGLLLLIISFKKVRFSFWFFSLGVYMVPTLTGTFTSMPRYILMMFLLFPIIAEYSYEYRKYILPTLFTLQIIFCSLFVLGFWIA